MGIVYRMTREEMVLLSELITKEEQRLFPDISMSYEDYQKAQMGLEEKGYLEKSEHEIVVDRVIAGIIFQMLGGTMTTYDTKGKTEYLFKCERIIVHCAPQRNSKKHYLVRIYRSMEEFQKEASREEREVMDNG